MFRQANVELYYRGILLDSAAQLDWESDDGFLHFEAPLPIGTILMLRSSGQGEAAAVVQGIVERRKKLAKGEDAPIPGMVIRCEEIATLFDTARPLDEVPTELEAAQIKGRPEERGTMTTSGEIHTAAEERAAASTSQGGPSPSVVIAADVAAELRAAVLLGRSETTDEDAAPRADGAEETRTGFQDAESTDDPLSFDGDPMGGLRDDPSVAFDPDAVTEKLEAAEEQARFADGLAAEKDHEQSADHEQSRDGGSSADDDHSDPDADLTTAPGDAEPGDAESASSSGEEALSDDAGKKKKSRRRKRKRR